MLAKAVIIGRPNVGKSTLFNRIIGRRRALTHETPYLTRDALIEPLSWNDMKFEIIDTAGMDVNVKNKLNDKIVEFLKTYIEKADLIYFVVDGFSQITLLDEQIVNLLRKSGKKIVLVVNKVDDPKAVKLNYEFNKFGFKDMFFVSALHGSGVADILDFACKYFKEQGFAPVVKKAAARPVKSEVKRERTKAKPSAKAKKAMDEEQYEELEEFDPKTDIDDDDPDAMLEKQKLEQRGLLIKKAIDIALIGQPNSGKSSYLNAILGYERTLVCEEPGTTRDSIDTRIDFEGREINLIDTAGVRKHTSSYDNIEFYSVKRSISSLEKADVAIILIDITRGITFQDKHLLDLAFENGKGVVLVLNKIDLVKKSELEKLSKEIIDYIHEEFPDSANAPKFFISAKKGLNTFEPLKKAIEIYEKAVNSAITTSVLNSYLTEIVSLHPPASYKGKPLKIYYSTIIARTPPTFILFVNDTAYVSSAYRRYIINKFRAAFEFEGYPIRLVFKKSLSRDQAVERGGNSRRK
ncbi:MAG: GTPase Der [bacterium ADurb.Bin243]|nr:MAG: GTPase Der [bacterium ADurb.Bin243]